MHSHPLTLDKVKHVFNGYKKLLDKTHTYLEKTLKLISKQKESVKVDIAQAGEIFESELGLDFDSLTLELKETSEIVLVTLN